MIKSFHLYLCCIGVVNFWVCDARAEIILRDQNDSNDEFDSHVGDDKLDRMNDELLRLNRINAQLEWKSAIEPSADILKAKMDLNSFKVLWKTHWCDKLETNVQRNNQSRMIHLLCDRGPKYSSLEMKRLGLITDQMLLNNRMKKICRIHIDNHTLLGEEMRIEKCYRGEHEVKRFIQISRDENVRRWAWDAWLSGMSAMKPLFTESIIIQNSGARRNGFTDIGACWREEVDVPNVEDLADDLWRSIKPLYELVHAVVRFRLRKIYPDAIPRATAPIPAHLIGDLWLNDWQSLVHILFPQDYINITDVLVRKNYTVERMVKDSEDFFTSLQFPPMTHEFWMKSRGTQRKNSILDCHGSARNMYGRNDFRILGCFEVNEESFRTIHHEMGHVQYYMAYKNQPTIYQNGVNSAFHESIGDALFLGVMTPQHLRRLGFISDKSDNTLSINSLALLLKQALIKIPQIPFALMMEKWRWRIFEGVVDENEYNKAWWDFHRSMMGIVPPNSRDSASYFDATKYHIISNIPYIRYFFGTIFQFQIFENMCESATIDRKRNSHDKFDFLLHECDIYGAQDAGNNLRKLMMMGSSISTQQAFQQFFNTTGYRTDSLIKYFQPIKKFMEEQIQFENIPVGWD